MTDLRQGVTPTQHAVLDRIEQQHAIMLAELAAGEDGIELEDRIASGKLFAHLATRQTTLTGQREACIAAAAILIDCADEITRLIGDDPLCASLSASASLREPAP